MCQGTNFLSPKPKFISKESQIVQLGRTARDKMAMATQSRPLDDQEIETSTQDHNYVDLVDPFEIQVINEEEIGTETRTQETKNSNQEKHENDQTAAGAKKSILGPARKRQNKAHTLRKNALSYLTSKDDKVNETKLKEIELQERKLNVEETKIKLEERKIIMEEKKTEIEILERSQKLEVEKHHLQLEKQRMDLDYSERKALNNLIASNQKVIEGLLSRINTLEKGSS